MLYKYGYVWLWESGITDYKDYFPLPRLAGSSVRLLFIQTFASTHLLRSEGEVFSPVCPGSCAALMHVRFDAR